MLFVFEFSSRPPPCALLEAKLDDDPELRVEEDPELGVRDELDDELRVELDELDDERLADVSLTPMLLTRGR